MKIPAFRVALAAITLAVAGSTAVASITVETDLLVGNSFGFGFRQDSADRFDHVQFRMTSAPSNNFEFVLPRTNGWGQTDHNDRLVIADGHSSNSFRYELWFTGDPWDDVKFSIEVFDGDRNTEHIISTFHGRDRSWSFEYNHDHSCERESSVPEPSAIIVWSCLSGLAIAVGWRRRKSA